jgi:hypothetical protein
VVEHLVRELVMFEITAEKEARSLLVVIAPALSLVIDTQHDCELGDTLGMHRHT